MQGMATAEIQPIRVELEGEEDGRILASVPALPGVMAYGAREEEAVQKVKSIVLEVSADMIESGEDVLDPLKVLFAECSLLKDVPKAQRHGVLPR